MKVNLIFSFSSMVFYFSFPHNQVKEEIEQKNNICPLFIEPPVTSIQEPEFHPVPNVHEIFDSIADHDSNDIILMDFPETWPLQIPDKPLTDQNIDLSGEEFIEAPDEFPEPIGGQDTLQKRANYTEIARRRGLEGTVYVQAKIDKDGNVVEATILKAIGGGLDEEALNAVLSTKFIPGKQRGRPVNVKMVIPIKFVLK